MMHAVTMQMSYTISTLPIEIFVAKTISIPQIPHSHYKISLPNVCDRIIYLL